MLQNLLRLGLYQIFWLDRIPDHAAVHETVELAKQSGFRPAGRIRQCRPARLPARVRRHQAPAGRPEDRRSRTSAIPIRNGWSRAGRQRWGADHAAQLMDWNNTPPKTFARVNTLKTDPGKLLAQWREENVEYDFVRRDWLEENLVFELKSHPPLGRLPSFQQGLFYVQDPSTLLAVRELDPQPGETRARPLRRARRQADLSSPSSCATKAASSPTTPRPTA